MRRLGRLLLGIQPNKASSTVVGDRCRRLRLHGFLSLMLHVLAYLAELGVVVASSVFTVLVGQAIRTLWTSMGGGR